MLKVSEDKTKIGRAEPMTPESAASRIARTVQVSFAFAAGPSLAFQYATRMVVSIAHLMLS